jgi:SnoaL-like domain
MKSSLSRFAHLRTLAVAFLIGATLIVPASASDNPDPFSRLRQVVEAWDKGDEATVLKGMSPSAIIIDDFPPHSWSGPTAFNDYKRDYAAFMEKNGITDARFQITQRPITEEIQGTTAYIVVAGVYSFKKADKLVQEPGVFTVALQKTDQDWRITATSWAKE